jgi:SnoaL-like domain
VAIHGLIAMHGHLLDGGEFDRLHELLTDDVICDVEDLGGGTLHGVAAIREAAQMMGDQNPVGHHTTNIVIVELGDDVAPVHSKGIGINLDGSISTVIYQDVVNCTTHGWRLSTRRVRPRRRPLET